MMSQDTLKENLSKFKRKHHLNRLVKGGLVSVICVISILLIISTLESIFWTNQQVRLAFLIVLLAVFTTSLVVGVVYPALALFNLRKGITDEQAAAIIGKHFPEVRDKLLNFLQLEKLSTSEKSLVTAAIKQKTQDLKLVSFAKAITFKPNVKFVYVSLGLVAFCLLVSFVSPGFFSESSSRIIQFDKEFIKPAPFQFHVDQALDAFKNEPFELSVSITGEYVPEEVFIVESGRKIRLNRTGNNSFRFKYPALSEQKTVRFTASGYSSDEYQIKVFERPEIRNFDIHIDYPAYTRMEDKTVSNTGSLIVPEGTKLKWELNTSKAENVKMISSGTEEAFNSSDQQFTLEKLARESYEYELKLENPYAENKSRIVYDISVTKDRRPEITVDYLADTLTFRSVILSGSMSDDYGFYSLDLFYKKGNNGKYRKITLPFVKDQSSQSFFYEWNLDTLQLTKNDFIELFVRIRDNDRLNGYKQTTSEKYYLTIPDEKKVDQLIDNSSNAAENQLNKTEKRAEALNEKLEKLEERLKNKSKLDWQGEKLVDEILEEKKRVEEAIEKLKEQHQELINSQKEFKKQSEPLQKKAQQLQKLLNEMLDEETKKMYEELQKLLKEKSSSDEMLNQVSQLKSREKNLEKELKRAMELFKRLKFETKLEQTAEKLEKLADEQQKLAEETEEIKDGDSGSTEQKLNEEQQKIEEKFEEIQKDFDTAEQLNQELKNPEALDDFNQEEEEIQEKLEEIPEDLKNKDFKKAGQKQQNAGQKMKKMAGKMKSMQMSMEMTMMQENIDHLRDILDNLIKISFEEEKILNEFKNVQQVDPRFLELSQDQLKLRDNARVIEDSLLSLANRVVQISSFVTREIGAINANLDAAMNELRERNKGKATSHQQYAMTSMNNLALLLDDVLSNMQMAMAEAMGQPQKGNQSQQSLPNMSELQQELSEQIQKLKKSGKSGRQLSEELAKLAAEQAELRRQLEEMQNKLGGQPKPEGEKEGGEDAGSKLKEAIEKMEENEVDLVNKQLTNELIERQQDIITRMLEAEESLREQKQSPEREGETAKEHHHKIPPEFEEYLKAKQSEIELLKNIPLDLNPFYKKEVNDYFRRLSGQNK